MERAAVLGIPTDLWRRIASAAVLAVVAVALTLAGPWPFAGFVVLGAGIAAWEWGRLVRKDKGSSTLALHAAAIAGAAAMTASGQPLVAVGVLAAGGVAILLLRGPDVWSLLGVPYLGLPATALILIRSDAELGLIAILYLFAIVWCADTAAYACGRLIGGPRLAPRISPNKTWAGLIGGILVPAVLGGLAAPWLGPTSPAIIAIISLGLALASQVGDLAESAAKRAFGTKDASRLIPGHGGLLDRVDGLLFASVAAGILAVARDVSQPGEALLMWP